MTRGTLGSLLTGSLIAVAMSAASVPTAGQAPTDWTPPKTPHVKRVVEIDVTQQRREPGPLCGAPVRRDIRLAVEHSHTQQLADESQQRAIGHPDLEHLLQPGAVQTVEEGHEWRLVGGGEKSCPLLLVECDRKSAQPVHRESTFLTHLHAQHSVRLPS